MKFLQLTVFSVLLTLFFGIPLYAQKIDQSTNPWTNGNEAELLLKNLERRIIPAKYETKQFGCVSHADHPGQRPNALLR